MTQIDDFNREITDYRNEIIIKKEKQMFKDLEREYKLTNNALKQLISGLYSTIETKEGLVYQKDLQAYKRLSKLQKDIADELNTIYKFEKQTFKAPLQDHLLEEYAFNLFLYDSLYKGTVIKGLSAKEITNILDELWVGELYTATLLRKKKETTEQLTRDLLRLSAMGVTLNELLNVVDKRTNSMLKHSLLVYQNELSRKKVVAAALALEKSGLPIQFIQIVSTLDERSCDVCRRYDGKRYKVSEFNIVVPFHARCRCRTINVMEGWEQGLRAARSPVTGKTYLTDAKTFSEWRTRVGI